MTKEAVIKKLGSFGETPFKILVDDQDVGDIITGIVQKHNDCIHHYNVIYPMFDKPGSWYQVGQRLFDFCKEQLQYSVESLDLQLVSTPATILKRGYSDCKGYALFIGGIIDAMKRAGEQVEWCYRFGSYKLLNPSPGHVFVVINPSTDNIWVDPCMDTFNSHFPFPYYRLDEYVETCRSKKVAGVGFLGGHIPGGQQLSKSKVKQAVGSAENDLLSSIKEYSDGVANGIALSVANQTLNTISMAVLAGASVAVPVVALAVGIVKVGAIAVSDVFGPGSEAAMLVADYAKNPLTIPVTAIETILNGRTYNSDQYRAAQFYQFYVLGNKSINALNKVSDAMVPPALKWFIDRTGVFVSGAEHIIGLATSPGAYEQYVSVNADTTTDANRVNAASNIASQYFIFNGVAGSWANTVGVYDITLANIAIAQNETIEAAAAQANYTDVYSTAATSGPNPVTQTPGASTFSFPVIPVLIVAAVLLILTPSTK